MRKMNRSIAMAAVFMAASFSTSAQTVLTIDKALEIAETSSPELRTSLYNLERSELLLMAQRASLKSQFSLTLNPISYTQTRSFDQRVSQWYTNKSFNTSGTFRIEQPIIWTNATLSLVNTFGWQNNESETAGGTNTNKAFSNNLRLQLNQPIFTYNSQKMELEELEYDYENMYISHALQRLNLERSITSQFYSVYTSQNNLQISKDELANAEQNYQIIKDKVEADLLAREELFQAELNLASARSTVNNRIVSLENAKDNLKKILGMPLDEDISILAHVDSVKTVKIDVNKAVKNALDTRLELRQREIQTELLEFQLIKTKAQNEFKGDVNLSLGIMGDNEEFGNIYKNPTNSPSVQVSFNVPIFDWGANKKRVK
ncbi:MAG: TolC family protein, partial [Bacteroidaceae bacterium]|nr:TolC family protein [Bacteroidaceae bacterium]